MYALYSHPVSQSEASLDFYDGHVRRQRAPDLWEAGGSHCVKLTQKQMIDDLLSCSKPWYLNYFLVMYLLRKAAIKFVVVFFFLFNFDFKIASSFYTFIYMLYLNIMPHKYIYLYLSDLEKAMFFQFFLAIIVCILSYHIWNQ